MLLPPQICLLFDDQQTKSKTKHSDSETDLERLKMLINDNDDDDPCIVHKSVLISVHNRMLIKRCVWVLHEYKAKQLLKLNTIN